jgi:hypothetical protein
LVAGVDAVEQVEELDGVVGQQHCSEAALEVEQVHDLLGLFELDHGEHFVRLAVVQLDAVDVVPFRHDHLVDLVVEDEARLFAAQRELDGSALGFDAVGLPDSV